MSFKFESPVSLPRFTTEQYKIQKAKYVAKHGYTVHVPGFEDIFKWDTTPDPTAEELVLYKKKDVESLGLKRFEEIKQLNAKKKETFLRMLASPTPDIVTNAASILTTLDDINDALGTFAVIARIVARRLPAQAAKFILGPAGWALLGADIAGLALQLSSLPYKSRRIQHALNDTVKGNPLSKRAKIKRLNKLKRLRLTKGEIIEAMQTTENMFGIGLCLGPIVGLVYDIPAGIYRHLAGYKVSVTGLPAPLVWLEGVASNVLRSASQLFCGLPPELDPDLPKAMAAVELSSRVMHSYLDRKSPLDVIDLFGGVLMPARVPEYPLTRMVVEDELGRYDLNTGWVHNSEPFTEVVDIFNISKDRVMENVTNWRKRNTKDIESMVGSQNQVEAGLNLLATLEGEEALELEYDPFSYTMLKLMNQGYRLPPDVTTDKLVCFIKQLDGYHRTYGEVPFQDALDISNLICDIDMTMNIPERPGPTPEELAWQREHALDSLKKWYYGGVLNSCSFQTFLTVRWRVEDIDRILDEIYMKQKWLDRYGYPPGYPTDATKKTVSDGLSRLFKRRAELSPIP